MKRFIPTLVALTIGSLLATQAPAAVLEVTGAVFSPDNPPSNPEPDGQDLLLISIDGQPAQYEISAATVDSVTGGSTVFYAQNDSNPGSVSAALSGDRITNAAANVSSIDWDLNPGGNDTVDDGENIGFFMFEIVQAGSTLFADSVRVVPLDSSDNPIGTWELTINGAANDASFGEYGPIQITVDVFNTSNHLGMAGVAFTLADFGNDTGTLTGVAGLRFIDDIGDSGSWDPAIAGTFTPIPTPAALPAGLAMLALTLTRRRRR